MSEATAEIAPTETVETAAAPTTTVSGTAAESEQKIESVGEKITEATGNIEVSTTGDAGETSGEAAIKREELKADEGMEVDVSFVLLINMLFINFLHLGAKG